MRCCPPPPSKGFCSFLRFRPSFYGFSESRPFSLPSCRFTNKGLFDRTFVLYILMNLTWGPLGQCPRPFGARLSQRAPDPAWHFWPPVKKTSTCAHEGGGPSSGPFSLFVCGVTFGVGFWGRFRQSPYFSWSNQGMLWVTSKGIILHAAPEKQQLARQYSLPDWPNVGTCCFTFKRYPQASNFHAQTASPAAKALALMLAMGTAMANNQNRMPHWCLLT